MPPSPPSLLRFWFTLDAPVSRREYRTHGVTLALVKYAGDALLVALGTGRFWTPQDYLRSVHSLLSTTLDGAPAWVAPALTLWTLPFLSIGISLTMRRAIDAGWSPWWSRFRCSTAAWWWTLWWTARSRPAWA